MARQLKIFFKTETMTNGEAEDRQSFTVNELIPAKEILVALEEVATNASKILEDIELVPGDFVEFSSNKLALLATVSGYPNLVREKRGSKEQIVVHLEPLVLLNEDGWSAKMTLYPPLDGNDLPDSADIIALLEKADVRWGIREKNIAACITAVKTEKRPLKNHVIARGRLPVNGENARLRIDIATGEQPGKELGDGRMDFRERRLFVGVDQGQLLATKIPATTGIPGQNIFGHEVPQIPGKDLTLKTGEDIIYDENSGEIRAAIAGVLSVISDTGVKITSKHSLSGDIDYQTGNIDSRDAVEIKGSVKPGFTVKTGGDVVIGGNVDSASVISRANVVIQGGVTGKEAIIQADGDVDVSVVRNGSIVSQGTITITREAYFTEIQCMKDIICPGQTKVIGSDLIAGGSISVMDVDTETSPNSFLAIAVIPNRYIKYQKLLKQFHQDQAALEAWYRRFGSDASNDDLEEMRENLSNSKATLGAFNLVPGVGENDKSAGLRYACRQKITINGSIPAGAAIRIGNTETTLKKKYAEGHFALNSDTGSIEFHCKNVGSGPKRIEQV